MRYAIIRNGAVVNIADAEPEYAQQQDADNADETWIECPEGCAIGWTYNGQTAAPPVIPLNVAKAAKLAALATYRWQKEVGGIVYVHEGNPMPIPTERADRGEAFIAATMAQANPAYTRKIKLRDGLFIQANAALIIAAAGLIDAHVQACFDNEATLTAAILAAGNHQALAGVDITTGWPT